MLDRPIPTDVYGDVQAFTPAADSLYIFGRSVEERSGHVEAWRRGTSGVVFAELSDISPSTVRMEAGQNVREVALRSVDALSAVWQQHAGAIAYLDITGLPHHVWAPLLRVALSLRSNVVVIYVEPGDYRFSAAPTEGEIFDLSERIAGIAPLPGFVSLTDPAEEQVVFVPLLGFEGARAAYLIEQVQPPGDKVVPVIGVPGFRVEYPFYTYHANRAVMVETRAWKNVRYAAANCPFSLFFLLEDVARDYPDDVVKIAPIGTKPHALGAVLYAFANPHRVELVYDHPIRKRQRTTSTARVLAYHVSTFVRG